MAKSEEDQDRVEDYTVPAQHARPFNAGLKRKRIEFVPASTSSPSPSSTTSTPSSSSSASKYLSIVLPSHQPTTLSTPSTSPPMCATCHQPLHPDNPNHSSSLIHQLSLPHTPPPSHIDRSRLGLQYLTKYGWEADDRVGLGREGNKGIKVPVKARENRGRAGVGLFPNDTDERDLEGEKKKKREKREEEGNEMRLMNAKQVRRVEEEKRRKAERLRRVFYGKDLTVYLGPDG